MTGSSRTRPTGVRRLRPKQQGDLDGFCGVYSVVIVPKARLRHDAIRWLNPKLGEARSKRLYAKLMQAMRRFDRAPRAIAHNGLSRPQLLSLVEVARRVVRRELQVDIVVGRVPPQVRQHWSVDRLWRLLEMRLTHRRVAILGLAGRHEHWTVAIGITPGQVRLFDSGDMRVLRRSRCATRWRSDGAQRNIIGAADVVFIGLKARA